MVVVVVVVVCVCVCVCVHTRWYIDVQPKKVHKPVSGSVVSLSNIP